MEELQLRGHEMPRAVPAARALHCAPLGEVGNQDEVTPPPSPSSISPATEPALPPYRSAEPAKAEDRHAGLREVSPTRQAPPIPADARGTPPDGGRPRAPGRAAPPTRSGPGAPGGPPGAEGRGRQWAAARQGHRAGPGAHWLRSAGLRERRGAGGGLPSDGRGPGVGN